MDDAARDIIVIFAKLGGTMIDTAPNYAGGRAESITADEKL